MQQPITKDLRDSYLVRKLYDLVSLSGQLCRTMIDIYNHKLVALIFKLTNRSMESQKQLTKAY